MIQNLNYASFFVEFVLPLSPKYQKYIKICQIDGLKIQKIRNRGFRNRGLI